MGSFALTCAVSGLPIEAGDPVRYYLITKSPYTDSMACYIHDLWFPRVWPLRASYNDYGSVEDILDGKILQQAWLDGFQLDLVERGWGDNSAHDVPTTKRMSFEKLLEAVWERRVLVTREVPLFPEQKKAMAVAAAGSEATAVAVAAATHEEPTGVPTMERVTKVLHANGLESYNGVRGSANTKPAMLVDEESRGQIRVRAESYNEGEVHLAKAEVGLKAAGYATMLTRGTGNYADDAELLVRPLPSCTEYHHGGRYRDNQEPLLVQQAMIREDVWQVLCGLTLKSDYWSHDKPITVGDFRQGARKAWAMLTSVASSKTKLALSPEMAAKLSEKEATEFEEAADFLTSMALRSSDDPFASPFGRDNVPFTVGLATAFRLVALQASKMTTAEINRFLDDAGDFLFLEILLSNSRYQWRPSHPNGPQSGDWGLHASALKAISSLAEAKHLEQKREYEESEAAYEAKAKAKAKASAKKKKVIAKANAKAKTQAKKAKKRR